MQDAAAEGSTHTQNTAEAVHALTQHAVALAAKVQQLSTVLKQSSSQNLDSTLQHLHIYHEAVQDLQVHLSMV